MVCARTQIVPSVHGIVTSANANGMPIATSVPNMNASTSSAMGMAIDSPRLRSSL
jgi:hypothetical protein